jgi:hypothetical protein
MGNNTNAPIVQNPELLDRIIGNIQSGLIDNIGWLNKAFGRAERLVKYNANNKKIYTPNVYAGGNEYVEVSPDANIGNFSFFWIEDPQTIDWTPKVSIGIKTSFALIFWFDYRTIYNSPNERNKEALKKQILDILNGGFWLKSGRITLNRIYELAENIYKEFSLDEIDNQFLMHPYGGFRFEGILEITETCTV